MSIRRELTLIVVALSTASGLGALWAQLTAWH
jgi:hypothetical protein